MYEIIDKTKQNHLLCRKNKHGGHLHRSLVFLNKDKSGVRFVVVVAASTAAAAAAAESVGYQGQTGRDF